MAHLEGSLPTRTQQSLASCLVVRDKSSTHTPPCLPIIVKYKPLKLRITHTHSDTKIHILTHSKRSKTPNGQKSHEKENERGERQRKPRCCSFIVFLSKSNNKDRTDSLKELLPILFLDPNIIERNRSSDHYYHIHIISSSTLYIRIPSPTTPNQVHTLSTAGLLDGCTCTILNACSCFQ
jgi:hypothetical protein